LWFGEKDSLTAWYLAVNSIAGTPASFSLAAVAKLALPHDGDEAVA
jgi:hypothetical protein